MSTNGVANRQGQIDIGCTESGAGDPILYFHGTGLDGGSMLAFEIPLVESGFRLIIPNRPGYGNTPLSSGRSMSDCADLAASLLDALGISSANYPKKTGSNPEITINLQRVRRGRATFGIPSATTGRR